MDSTAFHIPLPHPPASLNCIGTVRVMTAMLALCSPTLFPSLGALVPALITQVQALQKLSCSSHPPPAPCKAQVQYLAPRDCSQLQHWFTNPRHCGCTFLVWYPWECLTLLHKTLICTMISVINYNSLKQCPSQDRTSRLLLLLKIAL